jgi:hypothetical protein
MTNTVIRRLSSVESDRYKHTLLVMLFTALAHTNSLEAAGALYDSTHVGLCSRRRNHVVNECIQKLSDVLQGQDGDPDARGYTNDQRQDIDDRNEDENWSENCVRTLKEQSPFTQHFRQALTTPVDDADCAALECDSADNEWYSPTGFRVIEEYIHLYPMWLAALQSDPGRLASDNIGNRRCESIVN